MIQGYCRNSTHKQDLEKQREQLINAGCEKIFEEVMSGGAIINRPELNKMLEQLRPGDLIVVTDFSRISRGGIKDMFSLIDIIEKKGANIKSLKESWIDTQSPQGKFLFTVIAGVNELEKNLVSQRTKESLANSRKRGIVGGRPKTDSKKIDTAIKMYESKLHSIKEITDATGVSKTSLYRYLK